VVAASLLVVAMVASSMLVVGCPRVVVMVNNGGRWRQVRMRDLERFLQCVRVFVYILNYQYFLIVLVFTRKSDYIICSMDLEYFGAQLHNVLLYHIY